MRSLPGSKTESVLASAGVLSVIMLVSVGWYYVWVKPNDERIEKIQDCMFSEEARENVQTTNNYHDGGRQLYAWCVKKVVGE